MDPSHSRCPAPAGHQTTDILIDHQAWHRHIRHPDRVARRALAAIGIQATVTLSSDRAIRRLNAQFRGRDKPTNVLTFDSGDIVLALETLLREAREAHRPPQAHLAHLVIHGALHLQGHDHHHPGEARRMEMAEARALARLGVANPWKPR